tara:strand:- start:816 stop:1214 length:399 start_codon:yes stop_codon:yes gene_type:complete
MSNITVTYLGDLRTEAIHIDSNSSITTDAPIDNQGLGSKFSPTDLVASSLGSCLLTIMGIVAKRHKINLKDSYANVEKIMSENPRRISSIIVDIYLKSFLDDKQTKILKQAAKHCPVHNSLNKDIDIQINFN